MEWLKRNLVLALGGVVTLALLGGGGAYLYSRLNAKTDAEAALQERQQALKQLQDKSPAPTAENIKAIEQDTIKLRGFVDSLTNYYQPGPQEKLEANEFKIRLLTSLDQLRRDAVVARVAVPTNYNFSFSLFLPLLQFDNSAIGTLCRQLDDIKNLCGILYSSKVYELIELRRSPASANDSASWSSYPNEYLSEKRITTNDLAVVYPYMIVFRSSTAELGLILTELIPASTGFELMNIKVVPAEPTVDTGAATAAAMRELINSGALNQTPYGGGYSPIGPMNMGPRGRYPGGYGGGYGGGYPGGRYPQTILPPVVAPAPVARRPSAQTPFLQPKPLKITLWVNVVRLKEASAEKETPPAKARPAMKEGPAAK